MPLSFSERLALENACRIANSILASDGDPSRVACALATFAVIIADSDPHARRVLAMQMLDGASELMDLDCVDETAFCNGHVVGSR